MLDLIPGDIVVEMRGRTYGSAFGVVERVSRNRAYVAFAPGPERNSFRLGDGVSTNQFRQKMGWRIAPLDAAVRKDILKTGFAFGPCSRAELRRVESRARELREYVIAA